MPKIVDASARRRHVGEAVLRVVDRAGFEGASLSAIAEEAGLAVGSVRHYFPSHDAILLFAMNELADRVGDRLRQHLGTLGDDDVDLDRVGAILGELLPLDEERRLEADVWLEFVTASRTRPPLSDVAHRVSTGIREVVTHLLAGAERRGLLHVQDIATETERLACLLDGLTLAIIRQPQISPTQGQAVLRHHLESLAGPSR